MSDDDKVRAVNLRAYDAVQRIADHSADSGQVISDGWRAFRVWYAGNMTEEQEKIFRQAFYAGAQHLWGAIQIIMDNEEEPTLKDKRRISLIDSELDAFSYEFKEMHNIPDSVIPPRSMSS